MNILYINSKKNWGGVASWMLKTARGLTERGHNIIILSAEKSKFTKEAPNDLNIIPCKFGFDYNPKIIFYIICLIKKYKIDLIVTNIEKEIAVGGVAAKICKIPNIRRVGRDDDFNDKKKKIRFRHEKFVDYSIIPCNAVYEKAVQHSPWLKKHKFVTIYNGRNVKIFDKNEISKIRSNWNVKENEITIGITAQLTKVKNIDSLIKAFEIIQRDFSNTKLIITGSGYEEENLRDMVEKINLENKVVFHGFTNEPQLIAAAYDIGVLVSLNEGFPNTIVEYMSVETPVVTTDVGGVKEIITDGENGLITGFKAKEIAKDIIKLLENDEYRKRIGKSGLQTIKENFTEDKMIKDLEKFLEKIINEKINTL